MVEETRERRGKAKWRFVISNTALDCGGEKRAPAGIWHVAVATVQRPRTLLLGNYIIKTY